MSLFGGMQVKEQPDVPPEPPREPSNTGSAFSFMNKGKGSTSSIGEEQANNTAADEPSSFSFMKKKADVAAEPKDESDSGGSSFKFMKTSSGTAIADPSKTASQPAPQPVVLSTLPTEGTTKKKKTKAFKPGHARAEVMGHMAARNDARSESQVAVNSSQVETKASPGSNVSATTPSNVTSPNAEALPSSPSQKPQPAVEISPSEPSRTSAALPGPSAASTAPVTNEKRARAGSFGRRSQQQPQSQGAKSESKSQSIGSKMSSFFGMGKKKPKASTPVSGRKPAPAQARANSQLARAAQPSKSSDSIQKSSSQHLPAKHAKSTEPKIVSNTSHSATTAAPDPNRESDTQTQIQTQPDTTTVTETEEPAPKQASLPEHDTDVSATVTKDEKDDSNANAEPDVEQADTSTADGVDEPETVSQKSTRTVAFAKELVEEISDKQNELSLQQQSVLESATASLQESVAQRQELKSKSVQVEEAIASEDYELAEALETKIAELKLALDAESQSSDMPTLQSSLMEVLSAKREVWEEEMTLHQSTVEELQNSIAAQEEEVKGFQWELDAATADERADLDMRQAKLKKMRGHLELDRSGLEEQIERYRKKADDKTAAFVKEKDRLSESKSKVTEKIAELKQELKRLEQEEQDLSNSISVQEDRIAQAESGLSNEKKVMDAEAKEMDEREANLSAEEQDLELAKARLADNEAEFRSQHEDLEISLKQARDHIAFAIRRKSELARLDKTLAEYLEENDCMFDPSMVLADTASTEVTELRKKFSDTSAKVQELTKFVLDKQATASSLRKQLEDIDDRVPELERAKKLAVSGRNFKEASRINNEIKELAATKDASKSELEQLNGKLLVETETLDAAKEEYSELQETLNTSEADFDTSIFEELKIKSADFREQVLKYARVNEEIVTLAQNNAKTCELMLSQLSIKHDIDWSPESESLDDLLARALATRGPDGEELLLLLDMDAPSNTSNMLDPSSTESHAPSSDLLGLELSVDGTDQNACVNDGADEPVAPSSTSPVNDQDGTYSSDTDIPNHSENDNVAEQDSNLDDDDNSIPGNPQDSPHDSGAEAASSDADETDQNEQVATKIKELEAAIIAKESEIDEAAEKEDFEAAEALSAEVDELKAEIKSLTESSA